MFPRFDFLLSLWGIYIYVIKINTGDIYHLVLGLQPSSSFVITYFIYIHESRRVRSNLFNLGGRRLGRKVQDSLFFQILLDRIEGKIMEDGCIGK